MAACEAGADAVLLPRRRQNQSTQGSVLCPSHSQPWASDSRGRPQGAGPCPSAGHIHTRAGGSCHSRVSRPPRTGGFCLVGQPPGERRCLQRAHRTLRAGRRRPRFLKIGMSANEEQLRDGGWGHHPRADTASLRSLPLPGVAAGQAPRLRLPAPWPRETARVWSGGLVNAFLPFPSFLS